MRTLLTAIALVVVLAPPARADGPVADGNWLLATVSPTGELATLILKVETKDGSPTASFVAVPQRGQGAPAAPKPVIRNFKIAGTDVSFTVSQFNTDLTFVGKADKNGKQIIGNYGNDQRVQRAKLTATEKDSLTPADAIVRKTVEPFTKAITAQNRPQLLQLQARQEKDAEKKEALQAQVAKARKDAEEQVPKLLREVVSDHADTPAAYDAAFALLRSGTKAKVTGEEAAKLVAVIEAGAAPYGPRFSRSALFQTADTLADDKALSALAVKIGERAVKSLTEKDAATLQVEVLTSYRTALANAERAAELAEIDARLTKLDALLDKEYLATVPPFKPATASRTKSGANRVAVLELFTGAQCPPCVAADVAFDALEKTYQPTDLVLIQYHLHIPGPDPLTNPDSVARWDYYRERFASDVRGTPTTVFNGKPQAGGGGGMANAEAKYKQYRGIIDPLLESSTPIAVTGTANRVGDRIDVAVNVNGAEAKDELKLRLVVVEETIKYVGGNKLRFHHQVVRATPGGPKGFPIASSASKHTASVDVAEVKKELTRYLDGYAANERPFPNANRHLDLGHLKVIALVQNDETGEILQAAQISIGAATAKKANE